MSIQITLEEEQRQLVLMALAHLAVKRPGWEYALNNVALLMDNPGVAGTGAMFGKFLDMETGIAEANKITWTCHICGDERPDRFIDVLKRDVSEEWNLPPGTVGENVRFCNDSEECRERAQKFRHLKKHGNT